MTNQQCCKLLNGLDPHTRFQCKRQATVTYNGKPYCKRHDPCLTREQAKQMDAEVMDKWRQRSTQIARMNKAFPLLVEACRLALFEGWCSLETEKVLLEAINAAGEEVGSDA